MQNNEIMIMQESVIWAKVQASVSNAVVQVFAQVAKFDWIEPYRLANQFENCGSGFLIDNQGHIITNAHVIDEAAHLWVYMPALGRQALHAKVISICPERDIALIRLDEAACELIRKTLADIPFLVFGNSDAVGRTDSVMSMGYPLGQYRIKSTLGIVSGRELIYNRSLLQITAPINHGNSGGPVFDIKGQVIGIAIATVSDANNISYALLSNEILLILDDLFAGNKLLRTPMLGTQLITGNDEKSALFGNPDKGLYVSKVFPGGLFDKAGVHVNDMLYEFGSIRIDEYGDASVEWTQDRISLYDLITRMKAGGTLALTVYRSGKKIDLQVPITSTEIFAIKRRYPPYETIEYQTLGGMVIMELTENHLPLFKDAPYLAQFWQPEKRLQSVLLLTYVVPGSYTHQLRLLSGGSIINQVYGEPVCSLNDFNRIMIQNAGQKYMSMLVNDDILQVLDLEKLLEQEEMICKDFIVPLSPLVIKLKEMRKGAHIAT